MGSRNRSFVWNSFTKVSAHEAECGACSVILSFRGGSTTNLIRHTRTKHPDIDLNELKKRVPRRVFRSPFPPTSASNIEVSNINKQKLAETLSFEPIAVKSAKTKTFNASDTTTELTVSFLSTKSFANNTSLTEKCKRRCIRDRSLDMGENKKPKAYQTRRITFSACHRLHSPHLNDAENAEIYGKCNHINGHGHNYIVKVTLFGEVDPKTGMIMNMTDLKKYMEVAIMKPMDHKNLDKDIDFFKSCPSTTENLTVFIWNQMKDVMKKPELLYEVEVYETENNIVKYRGE